MWSGCFGWSLIGHYSCHVRRLRHGSIFQAVCKPLFWCGHCWATRHHVSSRHGMWRVKTGGRHLLNIFTAWLWSTDSWCRAAKPWCDLWHWPCWCGGWRWPNSCGCVWLRVSTHCAAPDCHGTQRWKRMPSNATYGVSIPRACRSALSTRYWTW